MIDKFAGMCYNIIVRFNNEKGDTKNGKENYLYDAGAVNDVDSSCGM